MSRLTSQNIGLKYILFCSRIRRVTFFSPLLSPYLQLLRIKIVFSVITIVVSLNFIRLLRVVITPSVTTLLRGEKDLKQSDEIQAISVVVILTLIPK